MLTAYHVFDPPFTGDVLKLSPAEARQYFDWFVEHIPDRLAEELRRAFASAAGSTTALDGSEASICPLGDWLGSHCEKRIRDPEELAQLKATLPRWFEPFVDTWDLSTTTVSRCADAGIYFGEVLRARHPHLRWDYIRKPKNSADLNQPVLHGFEGGQWLNAIAVATVVARKTLDGKPGGQELRAAFGWWDAHAAPAAAAQASDGPAKGRP